MKAVLLAIASFLEQAAKDLRYLAQELDFNHRFIFQIPDEFQTEMMGDDPHVVEVLKER